MKVTLLSASLSRNAGGLLPSLQRLSQSLQGLARVQVTVLGLRDQHTEDDLPGWQPIHPIVFNHQMPRGLGYAPELTRHLEEEDCSLIHNHGLWLYPSAAVSHCYERKQKPYVVTPHGMLDPWALNQSRWKKRVVGLLYENAHLHHAACLHALCESEARSMRAYGLKNPIAIIPNGMDLPELIESSASSVVALRSPLSALRASGRKVLLYLGRLHPKKGLLNLLKAWKSAASGQWSVVSGQSEWMLVIAGWDQGGHEAELKRLATELGIPWADVREAPSSPLHPTGFMAGEQVRKEQGAFHEPHPVIPALSPIGGEGARRAGEGDSARFMVPMRARMPQGEVSISNSELSAFRFPLSAFSLLFLGPLFGADKAAAYRACDAFILPSFSEGLPMVVLEAWAYGKPVLMTPECNLPEGFAANAAIRIDPNPESIAEGLRQMFELSNRAFTSPLAPIDNHPLPHRGRGQGEGAASGNSFHAELPPATVDPHWGHEPVLRIPLAPIGGEGRGEGALRGEVSSPASRSALPAPSSVLLAPCSSLAALGANGRQLVAARFAWPKIAREMCSVYEWVLGGGPKPQCVRDRI